MKRFKLAVAALLCAAGAYQAFGGVKDVYPNFTWIPDNIAEVVTDEEESDIDFDMSIAFGYEAASFTPSDRKAGHMLAMPCKTDADSDEEYVLGTYRNSMMSSPVTVTYTPGPSMDPEFFFYDARGKRIASIAACQMCIDNEGNVHTSGIIDQMYDKKQLFKLSDNALTEVKQPFYHVGVADMLRCDITLYSDPQCTRVVEKLPKGSEVEVLLAERETETEDGNVMCALLVKTASGIVGWMVQPASDFGHFTQPLIIKGISYHGD